MATLAVVSVVLLAGCSGFGFGHDPTTSTGTTTAGNDEFPPGMTSDGVSEPFTLSDAHATRLQSTSYSVTEAVEIRYSNGTLYTGETSVTRVATNGTRYLYNSTVRGTAPRFFGGSNGTLVHFSDGSIVVRKTVTAADTSYEVVYNPDGRPAPPNSVYYGTPLNYERVAVLFGKLSDVSVKRQNGAAYRVRATSFISDSVEVEGIPITNATMVEFESTVTTDGFVREYRLSLRGTVNGHDVTVTERVTYSAIGTTTVERPSWYEQTRSTTDTKYAVPLRQRITTGDRK